MARKSALPAREGRYWKWACRRLHVWTVHRASGMTGLAMRPILRSLSPEGSGIARGFGRPWLDWVGLLEASEDVLEAGSSGQELEEWKEDCLK